MEVIVPALLVATQKELKEKLARLIGVVDAVQIDAVDGKFVAPAPPSWPYVNEHNELNDLAANGESLPYENRFRFEADLMVSAPEDAAQAWVGAGASRITIHAASVSNLAETLKRLSFHFGYSKDFTPDMLSFGVALTMNDDLAIIEPFLDQIDYVQCMGIAHIGRQGEPFDTHIVERIRTFHRAHPDMPVQVDGGVSLKTAPALLAAGAARLIIGSGIWESPDVGARVREFQDLALRYGLYER